MGKRVEYFFDYVSPYTYLADTQLPALVERTGAEIVYRPMLLGGLMKATGNSPPISVPAKGNYMLTDLQRWAARYGVPMQMNPHFPINTVTLMRGAIAAQQEGCLAPYHHAMFAAMWVDGANLADLDVVATVLNDAGVDATKILERTQEPAIKEQLKANTAEAAERGGFGAPTFFVGEEMFWGNDRLEFLEAALRA